MYIVHRAACVKLIDQLASRKTAEQVIMPPFSCGLQHVHKKIGGGQIIATYIMVIWPFSPQVWPGEMIDWTSLPILLVDYYECAPGLYI